MAFNDLREWIDDLEERKDLTRVRAEVDWDEEIGAITREVSSQFGPALLFENIKDHQHSFCRRLFTNGTGTRERVCRFLGVPETTSYRELVLVFKDRFNKPVKPVTVRSGPVKKIFLAALRSISSNCRCRSGIRTMAVGTSALRRASLPAIPIAVCSTSAPTGA